MSVRKCMFRETDIRNCYLSSYADAGVSVAPNRALARRRLQVFGVRPHGSKNEEATDGTDLVAARGCCGNTRLHLATASLSMARATRPIYRDLHRMSRRRPYWAGLSLKLDIGLSAFRHEKIFLSGGGTSASRRKKISISGSTARGNHTRLISI